MPPLSIEIWSDVVCPKCYVGKRRIEEALERFDHRDAVAARIGIRGVPYFVLDRRCGVSGAQPPELPRQGPDKAGEG
jgi:predicted DsbA family dithiol-disulfide isomerase